MKVDFGLSAIRKTLIIIFSRVTLLLGCGGAFANDLTTKYNLREPASAIAAELYFMHYVLMGICLVIFVVVFGFMFYSIYAHRKSKGFKPADFHENTTMEITWTLIPFLIVLGIGIYATPVVMAQKDTSNAELTIKVTGYQWKWGYEYLKGEGEGIKFLQTLTTPYDQRINNEDKTNEYLIEVDNPLVVPVNKKIRVVITANDVIHAWSLPAVGVKQDAIPGFVRDAWFKAERTGTFIGQCSELCGKDHAFMPISVKVVTSEEYTDWVNKKIAVTKQSVDVAEGRSSNEALKDGESVVISKFTEKQGGKE
ncbi:MAG: cytochrome c oxidase subunit II [Betaproteobacteria bacterium TMED82]|nr:MAG: cytochrome c oxidase subunit II [Betaproteobacteria bacterium TMED82]|tara:strand:- start:18303 stop:19232 length:930 start_codon:yes stop_codon:yes gene_type:complete